MNLPVQPFVFEILNNQHKASCDGCHIYQASIRVNIWGGDSSWLCRTCLKRMSATLKAAEKALPQPPKKVRPE